MATLQELVKSADLVARRLSNHLRYDVVSKAETLRRMAKTSRYEQVSDRRIREGAADLLAAEQYTAEQYAELMKHCVEIHNVLQRAISESK